MQIAKRKTIAENLKNLGEARRHNRKMGKGKRKSRSELIAKKRRVRDRKRRRENKIAQELKPFDMIGIEYYHFTFAKLHDDLDKLGEKFIPTPKRAEFWKTKERGEYKTEDALQIFDEYFEFLEQELSSQLSQHSIAYWIHVYRRLAPRGFGRGEGPEAISEMRSILEAGVQKYGMFDRCDGVGLSNEVDPKEILGGMLFDGSIPKSFREMSRKNLKKKQLVLLKFGIDELCQFYRVEALSYEISSTIAKRRLAGRGAPLIVKTIPPYFRNKVSDELVKLVSNYVRRSYKFDASATGTVFENIENKIPRKGLVLFPIYNVDRKPVSKFKKIFEMFNISLGSIIPNEDLILNLTWTKFPLKDFYLAHKPLSDAFQDKHGIPFDYIVAVVGALLDRVMSMWENNNARMIDHWQRGYEVISSKEFIITELKKFLDFTISTLGLQIKQEDINIPEVLSFLELTEDKRKNIDLVTQGPHYIFLPSGQNERFIDYVWVSKLLFNLFYKVKLSDQNFKGDALEVAIQTKEMPLQAHRLEADDGSFKQVDGSYEVGNTLIIMECKAKEISFGSFRGDILSFEERNEHVENILKDVDDKAQWLAKHPKGSNYDITRFEKIVPIGISPFNEFIPSLVARYWLKYPLPRVLFLSELKQLIVDGSLAEVAENTTNIFVIDK